MFTAQTQDWDQSSRVTLSKNNFLPIFQTILLILDYCNPLCKLYTHKKSSLYHHRVKKNSYIWCMMTEKNRANT